MLATPSPIGTDIFVYCFFCKTIKLRRQNTSEFIVLFNQTAWTKEKNKIPNGCSIPSLLHTWLLLFKRHAQQKQRRNVITFPGAWQSPLQWPLQALLLTQIHHQWLNTTPQCQFFANGCAKCEEISWTVQGPHHKDDGNWGYSAINITKPLIISALAGFSICI